MWWTRKNSFRMYKTIKKFIKFPKNINQKQIIAFFDKNTNTATPLNRCVVK